MPQTIPKELDALYARLQELGRTRGDALAIIESRSHGDDVRVTYGELARRADWWSRHFRKLDPFASIVPMFMSKSAENVAAMFGALGDGKVFSCLNRKLRPPQVEAILKMANAKYGLLDGSGFMSWRDKFQDGWVADTEWLLLPGSPMDAIVGKILSRMDPKPRVRHFEPSSGEVDGAEPAITYESRPSVGPESPGACLFTSGSTGAPKGVLISKGDLSARAESEAAWFELTQDDILLNILPFSFDVGLNQLLSALYAGCTIVLIDSWLAVDIQRATAEYKITGISSVPPIWQDMLNAGLTFDTRGEHSSLRYLTISGGDLTAKGLDRIEQLAPGVGIYKTYGQTETFRSSSLRPLEFEARKQSVGRPYSGTNVYIVRPDGLRAAPNENGEVVHTGLGVMLGYLTGEDPENKLRPNPFCGTGTPADLSPKAVFTGDSGYVDEDGFLFLLGRSDSMLKISSNRVYPGEVAAQILDVPTIRDVFVCGLSTSTEEPKQLVAFVVAKSADSPADSSDNREGSDARVQNTPLAAGSQVEADESLRRELTQRLPSYMVPQLIIWLPELPRTASGKYDGATLKELGRTRLTELNLAPER